MASKQANYSIFVPGRGTPKGSVGEMKRGFFLLKKGRSETLQGPSVKDSSIRTNFEKINGEGGTKS